MSGRTMTSGHATALGDGLVRPIVFVQIEFDSGTARLSTASYPLPWDGYNWGGYGNLLTVDRIEEDATLSAPLARVGVSGLDTTIAAQAMTERYLHRPMTIWVGLLDANHQVIADPVVAWDGEINNAAAEYGDTASITVTGVHFLDVVFRARPSRFNNADQQDRYPGDLFFEYLERMQTAQIVWGYHLDANRNNPPRDNALRGYVQGGNGPQASQVGIITPGGGSGGYAATTRGYR